MKTSLIGVMCVAVVVALTSAAMGANLFSENFDGETWENLMAEGWAIGGGDSPGATNIAVIDDQLYVRDDIAHNLYVGLDLTALDGWDPSQQYVVKFDYTPHVIGEGLEVGVTGALTKLTHNWITTGPGLFHVSIAKHLQNGTCLSTPTSPPSSSLGHPFPMRSRRAFWPWPTQYWKRRSSADCWRDQCGRRRELGSTIPESTKCEDKQTAAGSHTHGRRHGDHDELIGWRIQRPNPFAAIHLGDTSRVGHGKVKQFFAIA